MRKPIIERKSKEHYKFLRRGFNTYFSYKKFMQRKDFYVVVLRNKNIRIIGLCLVRKNELTESKWFKVLDDEGNPVLYKGRPKLNLLGRPMLDNEGKPLFYKGYPKRVYKVAEKYETHHIVLTLVHKDNRGQGINQHLLNFIYDNSKRIGKVRFLYANIRKSNKTSIRSFDKNGFKVSKLYTKPYKNGEKKIRVTKDIKKDTIVEKIVDKVVDKVVNKLDKLVDNFVI